MARIQIKIIADSPFSLGTTKSYGGTLIESGQYVSGAHLRGALGSIKQYYSLAEQAELDQLLGNAEHAGMNFPNCYPADSFGESVKPGFPLPMTARTCKRKGGFRHQDNHPYETHGVADTLLMQLAYGRVAGDGSKRNIPLPFQYRCPQCGTRTEPYNGFAEYRQPGSYMSPQLSSHRQTRVAINRARLTAEEGQLYSVQALDEGTVFIGVTEFDDALVPLASKWFSEIKRIGGRTSRGFGRAQVEMKTVPQDDSVRSRLESFNHQLRVFENELGILAREPRSSDDVTFFTINLRSDTLLYTTEGVPTLKLDQLTLHGLLSAMQTEKEHSNQLLDQLSLRFVTQYTAPQRVSGWQTGWQLPKEVSLASRMGGLYIFAVDDNRDMGKKEFLADLLERLEANGIGDRRADGYGQITICDSFHLEVNPV